MPGILEPEISLQIIPADQLAGVLGQNAVIVAQMLSGGTAIAGDLYDNITNDTALNNTLFGRRSHIAGLIRNFKRENGISRLDAIPLADDGGAAKGTCVITISGPATENGPQTFSVCSENDHEYKVDILDQDTATEIGDALVALMDADLDAPFTVANVAGVVTVTAENGGTLCNDWDVRYSGMVAGVGVALTGWTGGATDPALTGVFDVVADIRYQTIIWPSAYSLAEAQTFLDERFNEENQILDGIAFQCKKGTSTEVKAYANQNSQSIVIIGNKTLNETNRKGTAVPEMPDTMMAQVGAIRALRRTKDAQLSDYLTTVAPDDQFGGIEISSLPYFNTAMPNTSPALQQDFWTLPEQKSFKSNAVSIVGPNRAFNGTIMGTFVTTYLTDNAGNPDDSYRNVNTVDTASVVRESLYENSRVTYAQTRLTDGDLLPRRDMANEGSIRAFILELYDVWAEEALVQKGSVAKKDFSDNLSIVVSVREGKVALAAAPLLVTQFRVMLGTIQIKFSS